MAVPKYKISKSRSRSRRANYKTTAVNVTVCPQCGKHKQPHRICLHCGYYKGRPVIQYQVKEQPQQLG